MDIRQQVGANVRRLREARGWSQEQLAELYKSLNTPPEEPSFEVLQLG